MSKAKKKVTKKTSEKSESSVISVNKPNPLESSPLSSIFNGRVFFSISRNSASASPTSPHNDWCVDVLGLSRNTGELVRERVVSGASYARASSRLGRLMKVITFATINQRRQPGVEDLAS